MNSRLNQFVSVGALALLVGCHSTPPARPRAAVPGAGTVPSSTNVGGSPSANGAAASVTGASPSPTGGAGARDVGAGGAGGESVAIPPRAAQQYTQALQMMKSGRKTDAELELKQLSVAYPQFAGPQINLGLLYLQDSRLKDAEAAFKAALKSAPANPVACDELGIVERKLGKFADAEAAYLGAIAAEPNYAAAHLNLGVLYDLYMAEPQKALDQYERYIEIAGENKQVAGWVVELRKRVGAAAPAVKKEPA